MVENALIPQHQADLIVVDVRLTAVLFPDGETGAVFPIFCAGLDLEDGVQVHRLKKHPALSAALVLAQIQTAGGPQVTNVLLSWGIPMWLGSLRTGSQSPEYRARIVALQREVCKAIAQLFHQVAPAPAEAAAQAPPLAPPTIEADAAPRSAWERLLTAIDESKAAIDATKRALVALRQEEQAERARLEQRLLRQEQRVADLKEWFTSLDRQVALLGQRQQEPTLSATHLADLKAIFRDLEQTARRAQTHMEEELTTLFKVEAITTIPDACWPEVLAWYAWSVRPT